HRGDRRHLHLLARGAWPLAVRGDAHRPRHRALHAAAFEPECRRMNRALYARRRARNSVVAGISFVSAAIGLTALALVLISLIAEGLSGITLRTFPEMTPPPGSAGGLLNAIVGSLILTVIATLIGAPLGIFAGTYMAEYGRYTKITPVIRFINDILLS